MLKKSKKGSKEESGEADTAPITITLEFKRYLYDDSKKMAQ